MDNNSKDNATADAVNSGVHSWGYTDKNHENSMEDYLTFTVLTPKKRDSSWIERLRRNDSLVRHTTLMSLILLISLYTSTAIVLFVGAWGVSWFFKLEFESVMRDLGIVLLLIAGFFVFLIVDALGDFPKKIFLEHRFYRDGFFDRVKIAIPKGSRLTHDQLDFYHGMEMIETLGWSLEKHTELFELAKQLRRANHG